MSDSHVAEALSPLGFTTRIERIRQRTEKRIQIVDLTEQVLAAVADSGLRQGLVSIQTHHTTTAIVINEGEPLLHEDFSRLLERWAPRSDAYQHDRWDLRTVNLAPGERVNGDAHARAILLGASETLHVIDRELQLGRWQRILLVELDGPRLREVSIATIGFVGDSASRRTSARLC
ncbi:MAG: YjbQ family protein [Acidobacteriota bacterium]|nr:MAG: YjbQ family protein [Acidobacteriota bacterium]